MIKNPLLKKAEANVLQTVQDQDMVGRLVQAGMRVIYDQKSFQRLTGELAKSKDPVGDAARGMMLILSLLQERARGSANPEALVQAGMLLLLDALDFLEQAGMLKVDNAALDHATEEYIEAVMPALGLSPEDLGNQLQQVQQLMADPQKMAAYQQAMGSKRK
jgi:hypothetical protein